MEGCKAAQQTLQQAQDAIGLDCSGLPPLKSNGHYEYSVKVWHSDDERMAAFVVYLPKQGDWPVLAGGVLTLTYMPTSEKKGLKCALQGWYLPASKIYRTMDSPEVRQF